MSSPGGADQRETEQMLRQKNSRQILEKQKSFNREWFLQDHIAAMNAEETRDIEHRLESDTPSAMLDIADSLSRLGSWHGVSGELALLDGSNSGLDEIHRSCLERCL